MFPGGIDPDDVRRAQERINTARQSYENVSEIIQRLDISRHTVNIAQLQADQEKAMQGVQISEIERSLAVAERVLNFAGLRSSLRAIDQANDLAETRLGSEGLDAARRVSNHRIRQNTSFEEGFEQASEKIRSGRASEVLHETATLAASDEVRETVEGVDKDALVDAVQREPERNDEILPFEIRAGVDFETVIELGTKTSDKEYQAFKYYLVQTVRVLQVVVSAVSVGVNAPLSLTQVSHALGGAMAFLGALEAREEKKRQEEES